MGNETTRYKQTRDHRNRIWLICSCYTEREVLSVTELCNQHWLPCRYQLQVEQRTLYKRELDKIMNRYTKNLFWAAFFGSIWFKQKVGRVYLICRIILRIIGWGRYASKDTGQGLVWFYSQGTKSQGFYVNCGEFQKMSGECGGWWVFKLFLSCYPPIKELCGEKEKTPPRWRLIVSNRNWRTRSGMNTKRGEFEFLNPLQAILLSFGNKVWVNTKNNLGMPLHG